MYTFAISTGDDGMFRQWREKDTGLLGTGFSALAVAYGWNESTWHGQHDWSLRHAQTVNLTIYRLQKHHKSMILVDLLF